MIYPDWLNILLTIAFFLFWLVCLIVSLCQRLLGLPRLHPLIPSDTEPTDPLDLIFGPDWIVLYRR